MARVVYLFRVALYTITLLAVSFLAVFVAVVSTLLGKRLNTNYYVARIFWHVAGPLVGWKFIVEGEEYLWNLKNAGGVEGEAGKTGRSAVMVGNHQSFVDILYLGRIFPKHAAIMAKKELQWLPGLGWFMLMSGAVFVNRSNNKSAVSSMAQAGQDMTRKRISLWIFPEGTRHMSQTPDLLSFKKGAFHLAVQSGVPVVPVVCQNYHHLFDSKTRFKKGILRIKVLPPIPTTGMTATDVPALIEKTRDQMLSALQSLENPFVSTTSVSQTPSPTRLLAGPDWPSSYQAVDEQAPLEGAVAGAGNKDEAKEGGAKKYAIA